MELISFKISTDNSLLDKQNHITPYISSILVKLYSELPKQRKSTLAKLLKYVNKFPKVPIFKNYLTSYYAINDDIEKARECNLWLLKEHPDYLFGKINYAFTLIEEEKFEEAKQLLGANLLLHELYPERDEFHIDEVMSYFGVTIKYLFALEKVEEAEIRLAILEEIDDEHPKYLDAKKIEMQYLLEKAAARREQELALTKTVPEIDKISALQTEKSPVFNFEEEIKKLYELSIDNMSERQLILFELLDKPKFTGDLIAVLLDSIHRFEYFKKSTDKDYFVELDFPTHALLLLTHLKSEKAIPFLLEVLKQNDDYIDFWFGDTLFELIKPVLFYSNKNNEQDFLSFIKEPNVNAYSKSIVSETLLQILYFKSDVNRQEFLSYCENILDFLIENKENKNILDTEFIGLFISDLVEHRTVELLPKIKELFDLEIVGYWVCGDYESVLEDISEDINIETPKSYTNFLEVYTDFKKSWNPAVDDTNFFDSKDDYFDEPYISSKKVGRNEPCPCGSGKKYKKCCINK